MNARQLYERFGGRFTSKLLQTGIRYAGRWLTRPTRPALDIPREFAFIGHISAIEYDARYDGQFTPARHAFAPGSRPLLAVGTGRGQAFLIGDGYRFTDRGFVDFQGDRPIEYVEPKCPHCHGGMAGRGTVKPLKLDE